MITYEGTKLSSRFQVKDQTKFARTNDLAYCCKCPENDCVDFYIGKTDRRISERIIYHIYRNKRDKNSHPSQHAQSRTHEHVWVNDFTILNSNYWSNIMRKISESLYIRLKKVDVKYKRDLDEIKSFCLLFFRYFTRFHVSPNSIVNNFTIVYMLSN